MNSKWPKWILISSMRHFKDVADANNIHFHIGGSPRFTAPHNRFVEFRMDGPITTQVSHNNFKLLVGISILYSTDVQSDYQDECKIAGLFAAAFTDICVFRYGDTDDFLGTLTLRQTNSDGVKINSFGESSFDTKIRQGSIDALYEMYLRN